jgi:ribonucleotide reductase alpha subunit
MWNVTELSGLWDWDSLKEDIVKYGVMNSTLTSTMPTASSASIIGSTEAIEPFFSNMYIRKVIGGEHIVINKYLIQDLEELSLWNEYIKTEIIKNDGSIQDINVIPQEIREKYKTVYEIPQKELINMSAERAPFIDQSQSLNIFMKNPTVGKLTSSHFHGWRLGLKTGQYYLRTDAITMSRKQLAIDVKTENEDTPKKPENSQFECFGCSA